MAAVEKPFNLWNRTVQNIWLRVHNVKTVSLTVAVAAIILFPFIVFGNSLVILSVLKDPLKKLRLSPSNFILLSMSFADLLVGLVSCPASIYWHWTAQYYSSQAHLPMILNTFFVSVSVGHIFLLTIDRFFALVTPLHYKVKVTNKRVSIASVTCWIYFLLFSCAYGLMEKYFLIMGAVYNLQIFCLVVCISVMYVVTLCGFHRYSKNTKLQSAAARQWAFQRERRVGKGIAFVICVFLLSVLPWFISQLMFYFCLPCHSNLSLLLLFSAVTMNLMLANSGLNPFLYAWRLPKYRDTFKHLLKMRNRCNGNLRRNAVANFQDSTL